jgi:hypothetical protein
MSGFRKYEKYIITMSVFLFTDNISIRMCIFIFFERPPRATTLTRPQPMLRNRFRTYFCRFSRWFFNRGHEQQLRESSALTQESPPQYSMLDNRNNAVRPNIMTHLHNDIDSGSESLALLHDNASYEERVSLGSLSSGKYLFE